MGADKKKELVRCPLDYNLLDLIDGKYRKIIFRKTREVSQKIVRPARG